MNAIKDFYLKAIDWVEFHPHQAFWYSAGALVVAIIL